ncbi:MAG TPA: hypothetical protein VJM32_05520 [Candidatus Saccharimonadales bacterium]|nr:hypothetical protein [Candidatus Saccharimonadales bacterium]
MLFIESSGGREEFEGMRGHLWEGIPTFQEIRARVRNVVVDGIRLHTALDLPLERVGSYVGDEVRATYDGRHLRVWVVWRSEFGSGNERFENLERVYSQCADLYFDIVHGRLRPRGAL